MSASGKILLLYYPMKGGVLCRIEFDNYKDIKMLLINLWACEATNTGHEGFCFLHLWCVFWTWCPALRILSAVYGYWHTLAEDAWRQGFLGWYVACCGRSESVSVSDGLGNGVWCGGCRGRCFRGAVNIEVALAGEIPDTVEAHVDFIWYFLIDGVICKPN